jgi:hypothetical protein
MASLRNIRSRLDRLERDPGNDPDGIEIVIYDPAEGPPPPNGRSRIAIPHNGREDIPSRCT